MPAVVRLMFISPQARPPFLMCLPKYLTWGNRDEAPGRLGVFARAAVPPKQVTDWTVYLT